VPVIYANQPARLYCTFNTVITGLINAAFILLTAVWQPQGSLGEAQLYLIRSMCSEIWGVVCCRGDWCSRW